MKIKYNSILLRIKHLGCDSASAVTSVSEADIDTPPPENPAVNSRCCEHMNSHTGIFSQQRLIVFKI